MFRDVNIFSNKCLICNVKDIYKYNICNDCYCNLEEYRDSLDYKFKYLDEIYVNYYYNNFLKEIVVDFKYNEKTYLNRFFGEMYINKIFEEKLNKEYSLITYIPMTKYYENKRGYNQSKLISEYISKNTLIETKELLYKNRNNKRQKDLSKEERYENVRDIFSCREDVSDKNILIIDDIVTTGYTLDFAAKALKELGAKKVAAIVAATHRSL